jgi:maleate isomerase
MAARRVVRQPVESYEIVEASITVRIGIIFTPDNAADRDFWRWCPPQATLHFTRSSPRDPPESDCVAGSAYDASDDLLIAGTKTFVQIRPATVAFACTSGSFVGGLSEEHRIRRTMLDAGAPQAITTSGSVLDALAALGARRVAVGTPYDRPCTAKLGSFLTEAGFEVCSLENQEPREGAGLSDMTPAELRELGLRADRPDADVLFISCAALETYDLIGSLEREIGKPVVTSIQATMWAALGASDVSPGPVEQSLFANRWVISPARAA